MDKKYRDSWLSSNDIHLDLLTTINLIYNPCKLKYSQPVREPESIDYGAYTFKLNNSLVKFRVAKTTPTKIGQFVTFWKRIGEGPIQPYSSSDSFNFLIICTRIDGRFGQFVFPTSALCEHGVLSVSGKEGKRAIRVYPPWDKTENNQAQKTQAWQLKYFLDISCEKKLDCVRAKMLYSQIQ